MFSDCVFVAHEIYTACLVAGNETFHPLNIRCKLRQGLVGFTCSARQLFPIDVTDVRDITFDDVSIQGDLSLLFSVIEPQNLQLGHRLGKERVCVLVQKLDHVVHILH
jgi:hypothetical protein